MTASDIGLILLFVLLFVAAAVVALAEVAILRVQRAQAVVCLLYTSPSPRDL